MSKLLIVESPSKAKTLKKYLGGKFEVLASYGHVRDLIPKTGAVETDNNFKMNYAIIERNSKHVDEIARAVKKSDEIYLATDPDREGEAISWHILEILNEKKLTKDKLIKRVIFQEITKSAIEQAIEHPRDISMPLVNAQQARRALDYLVGFNLSPLLWKKIRRGLSAGRVQSPALRLIIEREIEIEKFICQEYWTIHLDSVKAKNKFQAKLIQLDSKKVEQFTITSKADHESIVGKLLLESAGKTKVTRVEKKQRTRNPAPPFTTSTLQQESVRKLGFTTSRAMRIAQQLYEGIDIGSGTVGLITYMRTDSLTLSNEAINQIRGYIQSNFDRDYLPIAPIFYKTKSKNAQEAHEAIRPTDISRTPQSLISKLSPEQFKLYEMIWKRSLASQMTSAKFDAVSVDLAIGSEANLFRATGQTLIFPGFIAIYTESLDDASNEDEDSLKLPPLETGEILTVDKIYGDQHFTEPPPRYSEASLVKSLEEYGIGRPSTYASIISTLQDREYVILDKKRFMPTDVGRVVNKFLTEHFTRYVDYDFTAGLESSLDEIAENNKEWVPLIRNFWDDFNKTILEKSNIDRAEITQEAIHEDCPKCGKPLFSRLGRRGKFIGCSGYPDCDYTRNVNGDSSAPNEPVLVCRDPETGKDVLLLVGPYGPYLQVGIQEEDSKKKPKRISVPKEISLSDLNENIALNLLSLPKELGLHPDTGKKVIVNIGRFGPYVNYDGKFKSIPKSESIFDVTLERGLELIAEAIAKNAPLRTLGNEPETNHSVEIFNGRYGIYLQKGSTKVTLSKDQDIEKITLEEALVLISNKEALGKGKKKTTVKKATNKKTSEKKATIKKPTTKKKVVKSKKA